MRLIEPSFEIWVPSSGSLEDTFKHIERVGRVCYKSEDKITDNSYRPFIDRLINSKHYAILEHGSIYLNTPIATSITQFFENNPYSKVHYDDCQVYVTTNYRVLLENFKDDLQDILDLYLVDPCEEHEKRITVHFTCDRGVSHEFVRHRVFSFAQESTRFCNYTKGKFGNELTFINPNWDISLASIELLKIIEAHYRDLIDGGETPQQARCVLPNCLKTELVMTGFESDWNHFFDLRAIGITGKPHPQAKQLAEPLMRSLNESNYKYIEKHVIQ